MGSSQESSGELYKKYNTGRLSPPRRSAVAELRHGPQGGSRTTAPGRSGVLCAGGDPCVRPGTSDAVGDRNPVPGRVDRPRPEEDAPRHLECPQPRPTAAASGSHQRQRLTPPPRPLSPPSRRPPCSPPSWRWSSWWRWPSSPSSSWPRSCAWWSCAWCASWPGPWRASPRAARRPAQR